MTGAARVVGFLAALAAVFAIAIGVGRVLGPVSEPASSAHEEGHDSAAPGTTAMDSAPPDVPGGLMVAQGGYSLVLAHRGARPGRATPVEFTIDGPDGRPATTYDVEHEKRMHLIAVRRDFTGFQHVHPDLGEDGVWTTRLDLTAGQWRLFADFKVRGAEGLTLGADLAVAGRYQPAKPSGETRTAEVDGYTVTLDGDLTSGTDATLRLAVSRDGTPVADLQPYLGAYGHLVALREGDLAYLHVHPEGTPGDGATEPGPDVVFYAAVPSTGTYRLYLDFRHQGAVRTAAFTLTSAAAGHR